MKPSIIATLLGATAVAAISQISAVGNKFFDSNGKQFFMKGIAYQLTENDPLVDTNQCARDAALMKTLGANSIRVYHVDPTADHSGCMAQFANAGIYLLVDLDTFSTYILPGNPSWNQTQFNAYAAVLDAFSGFDNTLGFFVGNEIIAMANQSGAAPYIKAATRDLKTYAASKGHRAIPIGYSAADIAELRPMLQDYLTCGGNAADNIDFFSLNSYEWCGASDYQTSGYVGLQQQAAKFPVPIFFSETGCNTPAPRTFEDQNAIFGPNMVDTWSGSLIYEWIEEANNYGLISYGPQPDATATGSGIVGGYSRMGTPTPVLPDFTNLKSIWAAITPTGVAQSNYNAASSVSTRACPAATSGPSGWLINGNVVLPTIGEMIASTATYTSAASATGSATTATTTKATGTSTSATTTATPTKNPASPSSQLTGMGVGLMSVMLVFTWWL